MTTVTQDAVHVDATATTQVSEAEYKRWLNTERTRWQLLADDRQRRINGAMHLINQFSATSCAGSVAVLLADLRTTLDAHRDPAGGAR